MSMRSAIRMPPCSASKLCQPSASASDDGVSPNSQAAQSGSTSNSGKLPRSTPSKGQRCVRSVIHGRSAGGKTRPRWRKLPIRRSPRYLMLPHSALGCENGARPAPASRRPGMVCDHLDQVAGTPRQCRDHRTAPRTLRIACRNTDAA